MFGLSDESQYQAIVHYRNNILKGMDAFADSNTETNFRDFLAYCREVFPLLLEDIKKIAQKEPVIVEGAHLLPELVAGKAFPEHAVFLVSTKTQQRKLWLAEMNREIPGGHPGEIENFNKSNKKKAIEKKRVDLHQKIAVHIKKTARRLGLSILVTDCRVTEQSIDKAVYEKFFPS
jgi:chromosomal replication initiation ATPase DnaA